MKEALRNDTIHIIPGEPSAEFNVLIQSGNMALREDEKNREGVFYFNTPLEASYVLSTCMLGIKNYVN